MARSPKQFKRYAWDSCSWIAAIWRETRFVNGVIENRGGLCDAIISEAEKGVAEILTSALSLAEVCKHPDDETSKPQASDKIRAYFENDYIVIVPLDRRIGELARDLMREGYAGLKPPDATHLAAAMVANVDELHTFDDKLLNLNGKLTRRDGLKLRICKPAMGGPSLPLLEGLENEAPDETTPAMGIARPTIPGANAVDETLGKITDGVEVQQNPDKSDTPAT